MSSLLHNIGAGLMEEMLSVVSAGGDDESVLTCTFGKSNKAGDPAQRIVENKRAGADVNNIKGILRKEEDDDDGEPRHSICTCTHCVGGAEVAQQHAEKPGSTTILPSNRVACGIKRCTPRYNNVNMGDLSPIHLWDGSIARRRKSVVGRDGKHRGGGDAKAERSSSMSNLKPCKQDAKTLEDSLSTVETAELSTSISSYCTNDDVVLRMIEKYSLLEMPSCLAREKEIAHSIQGIWSDNNAWQSYARFREEVENGEGLCSSTNSNYHQLLLQEASSDLHAVAHKISYPYPKSIGAYKWPECVHTRINDMSLNWECANDIEVEPEQPPKIINLDMTAMVFSLFAIPRAIQLRHTYTTSIQIRQQDDKELIVAVVEASWNFRIVDLCAAKTAKSENRVKHGQWKALASVQLEVDQVDAPYRYDASGINHGTVSEIRKWLFGIRHDGADAEKILNDFDLFRLIFAATFTSLTPSLLSDNEGASTSSVFIPPFD